MKDQLKTEALFHCNAFKTCFQLSFAHSTRMYLFHLHYEALDLEYLDKQATTNMSPNLDNYMLN